MRLKLVTLRPVPSQPSGTIFPGFMMPSGSSARLIAAMAASAGEPSSAARYFILPCPTPCSPVQVPSPARPIGVAARLPEPRAVLGLGRPIERAAAEIARDLPEALRLLGDAGRRAVKLDEQHRHFRQRELGIEVGRLHLQLVEQLD